jgi:predicted metal-dependent HD superfamily phosphohydrolase
MEQSTLTYHNATHVNIVLEKAVIYFQECKLVKPDNIELNDINKASLIIAALGHDIIYVPGSKYNEVISADYVDNLLSQYAEFDKDKNNVRQKVYELILGTTVEEHLSSNNKDIIQNILLDADMNALSDKFEQFLQTQFSIMLETRASIEGMKDFLGNFLIKPKIYRREVFVNGWDETARANINKFMKISNEHLQQSYENYVLNLNNLYFKASIS